MEPLLGQIVLFPYNFAPEGWLACQGQILPINRYMALYSLLGNEFGGDGQQNTFALPNLQSKAPAPHLTYCMAVDTGVYPRRPN